MANNNNAIVGGYQLVSYEYDNDGNTGDADNNGILDDTDDNGIFNQTADVNPDFPADTANDNDTNDDGVSDARGILTVKGRTLDGSEAQIEVEIPLRINPQDMNNLAPALWIGDGITANLGGLVVGDANGDNVTDDLVNNLTGANGADGIPDANIVVSNPNDGTNDGCTNATPSINGNVIVEDPRSIPPIDEIVQTITAASTAANTGIQAFNPAATFLGAVGDFNYNPNVDKDIFDPAVDCADAENCRYYYNNVVTIGNGSQNYLADGVAQVTLYSPANLTIDATGQPNFTLGSTVSSKFMEIYSQGNITINTAGQDVTINAFIHTPGNVTINGGGTLTVNGSIWAGSFTNSLGNLGDVRINPDTTDITSFSLDRSYEFYTTTFNRTPRPLTSSPTNWKTEEVN